jgi:hypothetical protein
MGNDRALLKMDQKCELALLRDFERDRTVATSTRNIFVFPMRNLIYQILSSRAIWDLDGASSGASESRHKGFLTECDRSSSGRGDFHDSRLFISEFCLDYDAVVANLMHVSIRYRFVKKNFFFK